MAFVGWGWNAFGWGAFGQPAGATSPVLQAEINGGYWSRYPTNWESGVANRITASKIAGGAPEGWNLVPVNLAKMLKRMEEMHHPLLEADEYAVLGLSPTPGRSA